MRWLGRIGLIARTCQKESSLKEDVEGIYRVLVDNYSQWYDSGVANNIRKPLPKESLPIYGPSSVDICGFMEQIILKLVAYKLYGLEDPENEGTEEDSFESTSRKENQDMFIIAQEESCPDIENSTVHIKSSITGKLNSSVQSTVNPESSVKPISVRKKFTEQELAEIQLDRRPDEVYNKTNNRLLDLRKLRTKNKDYFEEESKTSLRGPTIRAKKRPDNPFNKSESCSYVIR